MRASVIIPYYERIHHLQAVLKALSNQTMSACDYEVIVIDDGSSSSVESLIDPAITLIRTPHRGAAAARNSGIAVSKGEVIIFLDSDIVVDLQFVENHYRFHKNHPKTVALGARIHTDPSGKAQGVDTRTKLLTRYGKKLSDLMHPWFMTYTCNVSLPREWAVKELFDENYVAWGLEDSEWAYRLYLQGAGFAFIESVTGIHLYHDRTMTDEKFQGWKTNLAYTIDKHPELLILKRFLSVFDPQIRADYFETYDLFEETCCNT